MSNDVLLLLAEDEALIRMEAEEALKAGGYAVIAAASGEKAIELLDLHYKDLSGVITDIQLGAGPNGWDVARHARELRPDLPVVYATGQSAQEWSAHGVPNSVVVHKPFPSAQLVTAISTLLTQAHSNPAL